MAKLNAITNPVIDPVIKVQGADEEPAFAKATADKPAEGEKPKREEPKKKAEGKTSFFSRGAKSKDKKKGKR